MDAGPLRAWLGDIDIALRTRLESEWELAGPSAGNEYTEADLLEAMLRMLAHECGIRFARITTRPAMPPPLRHPFRNHLPGPRRPSRFDRLRGNVTVISYIHDSI